MTKLITPLVFEVLTSTALMEHANLGQVSFSVVDGQYYTFLMNRAGLQRLVQQIDRALKEAPISRRKRKVRDR